MKKILVPIDGSPVSIIAAEKAVELAKQNNSELRFITVVKVPDVVRYGEEGIGYVVDYTKSNAELTKQQTKMLDNIIAEIDCSGIAFEKKVLLGEPYEEILKYADEENCDFIVMGRRGFSKIKRFFIGSVTQRVISNSCCPVLVINETEK